MSEQEKKDLPVEEATVEETTQSAVEPEAQGAAEDAAPAPEETEDTVTVTRQQMQEMEQLAKALADSADKYLRLAAEYDNFRKRTAKEKEGLYDSAKADTIKPFLAVYDNLVRGVQQCGADDPHRQGLEMICKQFMDVLSGLGVQEIEAQDQPFDPQQHNAVMHVEDDAKPENTVVEVFQKGFAMGDKVLRFAMVKVAN